MLAPVAVDGVSLLPPDANSFSYSSPKPVPFLSYNAGFFPTHCVVILGDMDHWSIMADLLNSFSDLFLFPLVQCFKLASSDSSLCSSFLVFNILLVSPI